MKTQNSITYDSSISDYLINGKSLLEHLKIHEDIEPKSYMPAIIAQFDTVDRLLGIAEPDLIKNRIAIYLCGHCGGYDGNPIGIKIETSENTVSWSEIGFYSDFDESHCIPFEKVSKFTFDLNEYNEFLKTLRIYEIKA